MNPETMETATPHLVNLGYGISLPESVLKFSFSRSGGKGGQNVNKVETKATLHVRLDDLPLSEEATFRFLELNGNRVTNQDVVVISNQEGRSQDMNKKNCLTLLGKLIAEAQKEPKVRKPTEKKISAEDVLNNTRHKIKKEFRKKINWNDVA